MNNYNEKLTQAIKNYDVEEAEAILENQLSINKDDTDLWLKLAVTELSVPLVDYIKSLECIDKIYALDKDNIFAVLLECCINYYHLGGIDEKLFNKLKSIDIDDTEMKSILKYVMSWHYKGVDINSQQDLLEESIKIYKNNVRVYEDLGKIFINKGEINKGKDLIKKAVKNIKAVYDENLVYDFTDINEYFNEKLKGIHLSRENKEILEQLSN